MQIDVFKTYSISLTNNEAFSLTCALETVIKCKVTNKYHTEILEKLYQQLEHATEKPEDYKTCKA